MRAVNVHHFAYVDEANANSLSPHLWMGGVVAGFASIDAAQWKTLVDARSAQHFNHLGITLVDESARPRKKFAMQTKKASLSTSPFSVRTD